MSMDGQCTKWRRNIAENFNRVSRAYANVTNRQTTDGRATTYSERDFSCIPESHYGQFT